MATCLPLFSQWRSTDKIYLLKQSDPNTLLVKVYDSAHTCLLKKRVEISTLQLPANIRLATDPRAVIEHLVSMRVIGDGHAPSNPVPVTISTCQRVLGQAINAFRPKVSADSAELEWFTCPLTLEPFVEPVMDEHGHTFEKAAIETHLAQRSHSGCPINREPISSLTPNLSIKQALDALRAKDPIPNFAQFKKQNDKFAQLNAKMARTYAAEGEYSEALEHYAKMVQYTKDRKLYAEIVTLYESMGDQNKAALSRLYLASYQLEASQVDAASRTLEKAHSMVEGAVEITEALVELYLHRKEFEKAALLLQKYSTPDNEHLRRRFVPLGYHILTQSPRAYVLYDLLATWTEDSHARQQIRLQGACAALQAKEYAVALKFCEQIDQSAPFIDHLVHLNTLELAGDKDKITPRLYALANHYASCQMPLQEIKACKQISYRDPNSEIFGRIIQGYQALGKLEKFPRWYSKWLSHLIYQKNWREAEAVALAAKEQIKDPLPINESLEQIYTHYEGHKLEMLYLELGAAYTQKELWERAERVYRLGYERFEGYELALGLAETLGHQSKNPEAVRQYYPAFKEALLNGKHDRLGICISKIKEIDPQMRHLDGAQQMHLLTQGEIVCSSEQVRELQERVLPVGQRPSDRLGRVETATAQLPAIAFGAAKWAQYFGDVGEEPPLPADIDEILSAQCPFWPGKYVKQTHLLTLIPATVDNKPFCLDLLGELIKQPKRGDHATEYECYWSKLKSKIGQQPPSQSYWALMTQNVLEGTESKGYQKQCAVLDSKRNGLPYEPPSVLVAATAILMEHVQSGAYLFGRRPLTYTRCQEEIAGYQGTVGGFGVAGLTICVYDKVDYGGLAVLRKF